MRGKLLRAWLSARFIASAPDARSFAWRVRYALDVHTGRRRLPGNRQ